ncbi:MAG: hypothetical protein ACR2QF_18180 [Geminicoccaceae bacterium]
MSDEAHRQLAHAGIVADEHDVRDSFVDPVDHRQHLGLTGKIERWSDLEPGKPSFVRPVPFG